MSFRAAVIQLNSTSSEEANLEQAEVLIRQAATDGAEFIATPENTDYLGLPDEKVRLAQPLNGSVCQRFSGLARELQVHLLLGSFSERHDARRCFNTSALFGPDGELLSVYRKIHLFDVDISPAVRFTESQTIEAGKEVVITSTDLATVGMSICFDLRFSWLYHELRARGAELITVPSAFTYTTGRDHWHTLLRARAIETQSFVLAPAQVGQHDDEGLRRSYGHALIVDPWGSVLADAGDAPGVALAEIDLDHMREVRAALPMRTPTADRPMNRLEDS